MMLGDAVALALKQVGITPERVTEWLGEPCKCLERQEKLNRLDAWARRVIKGRTARARLYLESIMEEE